MVTENNSINLEDEFSRFLQNQTFPDWIVNFKKSSFEYLKKTPFPSKSMEAWRKFPLSNFDLNTTLESYSYSQSKTLKDIQKPFVELSGIKGENINIIQSCMDSILKKNENNF